MSGGRLTADFPNPHPVTSAVPGTSIHDIPAPITGSGDFSIGGDLWPGLSKLVEECGEVLQVAGKLIGSEGRTDHWSGDLRKMLVEEIGDLQAAIEFFITHSGLPKGDIQERRIEKRALFELWHREAQVNRHGR